MKNKHWICNPCGMKHGKPTTGTSTWHAGKCDWCGEKQYVTEGRDYGLSEGREISEVEALFGVLGIKK